MGPSIEEASEDSARRAVDFVAGHTRLDRHEADTLLSVIGDPRASFWTNIPRPEEDRRTGGQPADRVGTSPRPVMATRLILPAEPLRAAGWNGELP